MKTIPAMRAKPEDFPEAGVLEFIHGFRNAEGVELTPYEGRAYLYFLCCIHCAEHREHATLPVNELWPIVNGRLDDPRDTFPNNEYCPPSGGLAEFFGRAKA